MKTYYGFRYFSGKNTTWANTGKIAGDLELFNNKEEVEKWISEEMLSEPCGCGGGIRERKTRAEAIKLVGHKRLQEMWEMYQI